MAADIRLTPAHSAFIREQVPSFSEDTWEVSLAGQAASQRYFVRLREKGGGNAAYILVVWDGHDEDWPRFLSVPREIGAAAPFLPKMYHSDARHGLILEEDMGDMTLCRFACENNDEKIVEAAYCRALDALARWQSLDIALSPTIASRALDLEVFLWETDYFARRCVVDFCACEKALVPGWEKERQALAAAAAGLPRTFIHRDFQSENVLLQGDTIRFVDFQGARLGPPAYDAASLLYDPYVDLLTPQFSERLYSYYCSLNPGHRADRHAFDVCAAQRLMQALGAYGNLSIHKGKTRYREFVPVALKRLMGVLERLPEYKAIRAVAECCIKATNQ